MIAAIKKVPGLFGSLSKAAKKGYSSFATAWRKVPAPIRFLLGDMSVSTIYDLLKGFLL
ncbi:hypothetical protein [Frondihabitans sp. PhB188]|uniref:hypothetical protein n=1 Tax=Frondihabitans sp. PhB188 TaxID=2485200 RepID=UPI001315045F|nr:hypothetical protein [Frondihabitans sp. PhB188]